MAALAVNNQSTWTRSVHSGQLNCGTFIPFANIYIQWRQPHDQVPKIYQYKNLVITTTQIHIRHSPF